MEFRFVVRLDGDTVAGFNTRILAERYRDTLPPGKLTDVTIDVVSELVNESANYADKKPKKAAKLLERAARLLRASAREAS